MAHHHIGEGIESLSQLLRAGDLNTILRATNHSGGMGPPMGGGENTSLLPLSTDGGRREPAYPALAEFANEFANYHGYIAATVCVWGIIANVANIVVLTQKNMLSQTNLILMWLAVADLLTMTSYLPVSIHFYILRDKNLMFPASHSVHWIRFMLFHINFSVVAHTVAIWLTITLAIFRYLFICFPTRGHTLCSMERVKLSIFTVYICVGIICIPNYLVTTINKVQATRVVPAATATTVPALGGGTTNNSVVPAAAATAAAAHGATSPINVTTVTENYIYYHFRDGPLAEPYLNKFNYWIQAILIKLIPCVLLVILTILLIHAMHAANRRRAKLKSQGLRDDSDRAREQNRTTGMLLAIVALFLLTEVPQGILTLCSIFIPTFFEDVYWPLGDLLDLSALLNNSINFVLYCAMSRQFRDTFVQTFCKCCLTKSQGWLKLKTFTITSNGTGASNV